MLFSDSLVRNSGGVRVRGALVVGPLSNGRNFGAVVRMARWNWRWVGFMVCNNPSGSEVPSRCRERSRVKFVMRWSTSPKGSSGGGFGSLRMRFSVFWIWAFSSLWMSGSLCKKLSGTKFLKTTRLTVWLSNQIEWYLDDPWGWRCEGYPDKSYQGSTKALAWKSYSLLLERLSKLYDLPNLANQAALRSTSHSWELHAVLWWIEAIDLLHHGGYDQVWWEHLWYR